MKKLDAVAIFGSYPKTAAALGITLQAVHEWPDILPPRISDRVLGAATRTGREIPAHFLQVKSEENEQDVLDNDQGSAGANERL